MDADDEDELPEAFVCPISGVLMADPVLTVEGNTYDRYHIAAWLQSHNTDPLTNEVLPSKELKENRALRHAIEAYLKTSQLFLDRRSLEILLPAVGAGSAKTVFEGKLRIRGKSLQVAVLKIRSGSFDGEVRTLLKLGRHPRLVRFFGQCKDDDGDHLLVTEFAAHGSLSDAFEGLEGRMTRAHQLVIMQQTCQGMEHLAEMKLVHGDLAARNVLLCRFAADDVRQTSVKVCDFGLTMARGYNQSYAINQTGEGRPVRYMPPESLTHNRFSEKSDVWAFGVFVHELLTYGMIPYCQIQDRDLVAHVVSGGRLLRTDVRDGCSDELWALLESCWDATRSRRPSFSQLSISLAAISVKKIDQIKEAGVGSSRDRRGSTAMQGNEAGSNITRSSSTTLDKTEVTGQKETAPSEDISPEEGTLDSPVRDIVTPVPSALNNQADSAPSAPQLAEMVAELDGQMEVFSDIPMVEHGPNSLWSTRAKEEWEQRPEPPRGDSGRHRLQNQAARKATRFVCVKLITYFDHTAAFR